MSLENSASTYDRLNTIVTSLGMEISDSILTALRTEVAVCRREEKDRLALVEPLLLGIEAVARHIDEIRAASDARALRLLNELVQAYRIIAVDGSEEGEARALASEALSKVLSWQHNCIRESLNMEEGAGKREELAVSSPETEEPAVNVKELLGTVRQEIAATGMMAIKESAALLELVHVRKPAEDAGTTAKKDDAEKNEEFTSLIRENISSLQQVLHQEMGRLRHDFIKE